MTGITSASGHDGAAGPSATHALAAFGHGLRYEDIPADVLLKASEAFLDTVGVCIYGASLPWGQMVIDYATLYGAGGTSSILGVPAKVSTPYAALANGVLAHAFEMDNLRQPSAGIHYGATLVPPALGVGEEVGASGRDVLAAFVAASEVMSRIGLAADNTAEKIGFHSPGVTGTFGATVVAGRLFGLTQPEMIRAFGIAGSLCSGLLAFTKAGNGGMVKRLHTGRAAESGVMAARLAKSGFAGPDTILEGKFGVFDAFTRGPKMERLLDGLGTKWETLRICVKCYACHITAHTPVRLLEDLRRTEKVGGADISEMNVATSEKVLSHHNIVAPQDVATAQYSLPFCLAIASYRDPRQPGSFRDAPHEDSAIKDLATRVRLSHNPVSDEPGKAWATRLEVVLRDGRRFTTEGDGFRGAPATPMSPEELHAKFLELSKPIGSQRAENLLQKLRDLDGISDIRSLLPTVGQDRTVKTA